MLVAEFIVVSIPGEGKLSTRSCAAKKSFSANRLAELLKWHDMQNCREHILFS